MPPTPSDFDRHRKRKMAAAGPEVVVSRILYQIASKFQSLYVRFRGRPIRWTHLRYVAAWPRLRAARAADRASTSDRRSVVPHWWSHPGNTLCVFDPPQTRPPFHRHYAREKDIHRCVLRYLEDMGEGSTRPTARCSDCR
jgi:hypothetical protein